MKIRTFWSLLLKLLGLYLVIASMYIIPQAVMAISFRNQESIISGLALIIVTLLLYFFIIRLFVFKTDWLIEKLHLEDGFTEERIDISTNKTSILIIIITILGGSIFIEAVPVLCKQIFVFYQTQHVFREEPSSNWLIFYLVKTIVGFAIMTNSKTIAKFIETDEKPDSIDVEEHSDATE